MIFNRNILSVELIDWVENKKEFQLIDITNENLLKQLQIQSKWIPSHILLSQISELEKNIPIVLCCRVGADSFTLMNILSIEYQMDNVLSLKSGFIGLEKLIPRKV
jgi:rhodanese-related sulfurtransferase